MVVIGVALLAGCYLVGMLIGDLLGLALGVEANVGGVGFAMVLLVVVADQLRRRGHLEPVSEQGILFWSAMYIPIVVAMAATQNVVSAVSGGPMAIIAGVAAVAVCLALVPVLARIGGRAEALPPLRDDEAMEAVR
ncbi:malonate transporter subunit MadL [Nocardioides acrostichi]|uniref:Malonate transporter subunit MadL n=1 Tax=Nocardioides acrostichi TaxID=2784339 RepID=A0A930UV02_9ACTN|nr:malonate transporter subunit MadL [Nocardioides acrostichi]MBF4161353.1 malonate transporter subunit MadL [Nocardioides acrostichi]